MYQPPCSGWCGPLAIVLVGDARGLSHAMVKRLEALVWQNWPYTSGRAALRALLSSRLLMISFQRRMKFLVLSSSTPFSSRSALSSARMASAWASSSFCLGLDGLELLHAVLNHFLGHGVVSFRFVGAIPAAVGFCYSLSIAFKSRSALTCGALPLRAFSTWPVLFPPDILNYTLIAQ